MNPEQNRVASHIRQSNIADLLSAFREFDPDMPLQQALMFVRLVENESRGASVADLMRLTGFTSASATRNLQALGETGRSGRPGLGVVELTPDELDGRRKIARITPRGRELVRRLYELSGGPD